MLESGVGSVVDVLQGQREHAVGWRRVRTVKERKTSLFSKRKKNNSMVHVSFSSRFFSYNLTILKLEAKGLRSPVNCQ